MNQIRKLEELSMNAWPSLHTVLYDGWILRFAQGLTKRANSINPIYKSEIDINTKIKNCENMYNNRNLDTIFKMTSKVYPNNLDSLLNYEGYHIIDETSVQIMQIDQLKFIHDNITVKISESEEDWVQNFSKLVSKRSNHTILRLIIGGIIPKKFLLHISENNEIVAFGLGVLQEDFIGLYSMFVKEEYRKIGYATSIVNKILSLGKNNGAKFAYLQVMLNNKPALNLYSKLGFEQEYKYWYRIKKKE